MWRYSDQCYYIMGASMREYQGLIDLVSKECAPLSEHQFKCGLITPHGRGEVAYARSLIREKQASTMLWIAMKMEVVSERKFLELKSEDNSTADIGSVLEFSIDKLNDNHNFHCVAIDSNTDVLKVISCEAYKLQKLTAYQVSIPVPSSSSSISSHEILYVCPDENWVLSGSRCLRFFTGSQDLTWIEARQKCRSLYGGNADLVSLKSESDLSESSDKMLDSTKYWIGLSTLILDNNYRMRWSDQSTLGWLPFSVADLQVGSSNQPFHQCWTVSKASNPRSNALDCGDKLASFVCQQPAVIRIEDSSSSSSYHLVHGWRDWSEAAEYCSKDNSHLAVFHSRQDFVSMSGAVASHLKPGDEAWIGLNESNFAYQWHDRSEVNFLPLEVDRAKVDRLTSQDCFSLRRLADTGSSSKDKLVWQASDCSNKKSLLICAANQEANVKPSLTRLQPSKITNACPNEYLLFGGKCFKLLTESTTWNEARQKCGSLVSGTTFIGKLAQIDSFAVQEFLSSLLIKLPPRHEAAWIGNTRSDQTNPNPSTFVRPVLVSFDIDEESNEDANKNCSSLTKPDHTVSLLTLNSVFEVNYLRAVLRVSNLYNYTYWTGLCVQEAANVESNGDQPSVLSPFSVSLSPNYDDHIWIIKSWYWSVTDSNSSSTNPDVLYTDWMASNGWPLITDKLDGCYLFDPDPYSTTTSWSADGHGSLRRAYSNDLDRDIKGFICSTTIGPSSVQSSSACSAFNSQTKLSASSRGNKCQRWDLVPQNLSNFPLRLNDQGRLQYPGRVNRLFRLNSSTGNELEEEVIWDSFHSNLCLWRQHGTTGTERHFECVTRLHPNLEYESCSVSDCVPDANFIDNQHQDSDGGGDGKNNTTTIVVIVVVVLVLLAAAAGLAFYLYRRYGKLNFTFRPPD